MYPNRQMILMEKKMIKLCVYILWKIRFGIMSCKVNDTFRRSFMLLKTCLLRYKEDICCSYEEIIDESHKKAVYFSKSSLFLIRLMLFF